MDVNFFKRMSSLQLCCQYRDCDNTVYQLGNQHCNSFDFPDLIFHPKSGSSENIRCARCTKPPKTAHCYEEVMSKVSNELEKAHFFGFQTFPENWTLGNIKIL